MAGFDIYNEVKKYLKELLDEHSDDNKECITLTELYELYGDEVEYEYSVYNSVLFQAIADDLFLLGYCEEVEKEFGQGIATNPLLINEAILRYMLDEYGNENAETLDIEV